LVPCIPSSLIEEVLFSCHDDPIAGHLGVNKTLERVRARFWWPHLAHDTKTYVLTCHQCQTKKSETRPEPGLLNPITTGGPFEMIGMDLLGRFPPSEQRNTYIIVATDYLTRWVEAKAIPNGSSLEVAKFFCEQIVCRFGTPLKVLTDQGKCFESQLAKAVYDIMGSKHLRTTAYHPATNGLTERFNKTLATMISMYVSKSQMNWDQYLPFVVSAYNTAVQASTKMSPFFLVHGFEARMPMEINLSSQTMGIPGAEIYGKLLDTFLSAKRELARSNIQTAQAANKRDYDQRHRPVVFLPGDKVMVYTPRRKKGRAEKLLHFWEGVFIVQERFGLNVYKLTRENDKNQKIELVHVSRIKPYRERILARQIESSSETRISSESSENTENNSDESLEANNPDLTRNFSDTSSLEWCYEDQPNENQEGGSRSNDSNSSNPQNVTSSNDQEILQEEVIPSIRRSSRQRRAPQRLSLVARSLMMLGIFCLSSVEMAFQRVNPVI